MKTTEISMSARGDQEKKDVNEKQQKKDTNRKRKRNLQKARYDGIKFTPRATSGRPGSPHRFFSSSYLVSIDSDDADQSASADSSTPIQIPEGQVVHRHANGLAIVTGGSLIKDLLQKHDSTITDSSQKIKIKEFKFMPKISASQSVGGKRKKARKMKGGDNSPGIVSPTDTLAVVTFSDDTSLKLKCCVAGTLLEVNKDLEMGDHDSYEKTLLLLSDGALLDGYLGVIMPTSGFPSSK